MLRRIPNAGYAMVSCTFDSFSGYFTWMLTRAPRSPESSLYVMRDSKDEYSLSEAETLDLDETYDRASLELARTACHVPELVSSRVLPYHDYRLLRILQRDSDEKSPDHLEFEFKVKGHDSE